MSDRDENDDEGLGRFLGRAHVDPPGPDEPEVVPPTDSPVPEATPGPLLDWTARERTARAFAAEQGITVPQARRMVDEMLASGAMVLTGNGGGRVRPVRPGERARQRGKRR